MVLVCCSVLTCEAAQRAIAATLELYEFAGMNRAQCGGRWQMELGKKCLTGTDCLFGFVAREAPLALGMCLKAQYAECVDSASMNAGTGRARTKGRSGKFVTALSTLECRSQHGA
jgi:hypothetical protein